MKLSLAEVAYRHGRIFSLAGGIPEIERSLDDLARAGELYPYAYRFRTGQADAIYRLVPQFPDLAPAAEKAIGYALAVDHRDALLTAGLMLMQRRNGHCLEARQSADKLLRLGPNSNRVKELISSKPNPCDGPL